MLSSLHRERHADVQRQVEVFESELQADNGLIAELSAAEAAGLEPTANLELEKAAIGEAVGGGGGKVSAAGIAAQVLNLQEKAVNSPGVLPKFLGVLRSLDGLPETKASRRGDA